MVSVKESFLMCLRELKVGGFIFIRALFTITKRQKPPKCPLMDEWISKIQYKGILFRFKNGRSFAIYHNLGEP